MGYYAYLGLLSELNKAQTIDDLTKIESKISTFECYYSNNLRQRLYNRLTDFLDR